MKRLLYLLAVLLAPVHVSAQMLFSENMTMSIDSTKTLQGTISPSLNFQTEKEEVFTLRNSANINLLIKHSRVINLMNKFEFSSYGKKVTLSGGYIHAEFRYLLDHAFEVYPYAESQWAASRGMAFKFSTGLQSRYRLVNSSTTLMFVTLGLFYEYEEWERPMPAANGPDKPGVAYQILGAVADANIEVDMIIQNVGSEGTTDFSFTVPRSDYKQTIEILQQRQDSIGAAYIDGDDTVCKVSAVGLGMRSHVGVAAKIFRTLAEEGINIQMISTSEIKVSVLIDEKYMELATRVLHKAFDLGN